LAWLNPALVVDKVVESVAGRRRKLDDEMIAAFVDYGIRLAFLGYRNLAKTSAATGLVKIRNPGNSARTVAKKFDVGNPNRSSLGLRVWRCHCERILRGARRLRLWRAWKQILWGRHVDFLQALAFSSPRSRQRCVGIDCFGSNQVFSLGGCSAERDVVAIDARRQFWTGAERGSALCGVGAIGPSRVGCTETKRVDTDTALHCWQWLKTVF
jgi:hypothetical protein